MKTIASAPPKWPRNLIWQSLSFLQDSPIPSVARNISLPMARLGGASKAEGRGEVFTTQEKHPIRSPKIIAKPLSMATFIFYQPQPPIAHSATKKATPPVVGVFTDNGGASKAEGLGEVFTTQEKHPIRSPKIIAKPLSMATFIFYQPQPPIAHSATKKATPRRCRCFHRQLSHRTGNTDHIINPTTPQVTQNRLKTQDSQHFQFRIIAVFAEQEKHPIRSPKIALKHKPANTFNFEPSLQAQGATPHLPHLWRRSERGFAAKKARHNWRAGYMLLRSLLI